MLVFISASDAGISFPFDIFTGSAYKTNFGRFERKNARNGSPLTNV